MFLTSSDPTDHALAAIASILDQPVQKSDTPTSGPQTSDPDAFGINPLDEQNDTIAAHEIDVDNYSKVGPGPLDEIRFRWTARRDEAGNYFVDETIGPNSRPLTTGPMPRDRVVPFIDDRQRAARQRFDALRSEMKTGMPAPDRRSSD